MREKEKKKSMQLPIYCTSLQQTKQLLLSLNNYACVPQRFNAEPSSPLPLALATTRCVVVLINIIWFAQQCRHTRYRLQVIPWICTAHIHTVVDTTEQASLRSVQQSNFMQYSSFNEQNHHIPNYVAPTQDICKSSATHIASCGLLWWPFLHQGVWITWSVHFQCLLGT